MRHLIATRPRLATRRIFAAEVLPLAQQGITAVREEARGVHSEPLVGQPALLYTHNFYKTAWGTQAHGTPTDTPYPFSLPDPLDLDRKQPLDPFVLQTLATTGPTPAPLLPAILDPLLFQRMYSGLKNNKAPGPDGVPNELLKCMPACFKTSVHSLFILMWLTATTPVSWKHSITKLLHKKGDTMHLSNYRPLGLGNSLYKLWTRFITNTLTSFAESYSILSDSQEDFVIDVTPYGSCSAWCLQLRMLLTFHRICM